MLPWLLRTFRSGTDGVNMVNVANIYLLNSGTCVSKKHVNQYLTNHDKDRYILFANTMITENAFRKDYNYHEHYVQYGN